ncbi:hypothetical protein BDW74DRAFT_168519 [Aspergillus multicolor]|uniref:uncharacterized protein n=1 Tax=Aspergillus multicolor TaxID=41759 RepID=UPI003CCD191B
MALDPRQSVASTVSSIASLGFAPVAVRFRLFEILSELDGPATGKDVLDAYIKGLNSDNASTGAESLIPQDTLVAMHALSWASLAGENLFAANETTHYLAKTPSAIHGVLHFTTEVLLGSAFLMRKLEATGYQYPFTPLSTPVQYAYRLMGDTELEKMHTYAIMAAQGRMTSFNSFMQGRFGIGITRMPERLLSLGYDLSDVVQKAREEGIPVTMVDIGGGRGDLLLDIKAAIPSLEAKDLILQELDPETTDIPDLTVLQWDYAGPDSPQPTRGALAYHLSGVLHNLPDLNAVTLLRKIRDAMAPHSRILLHERRRDKMPMGNATMVVLYGGRERNISEWNGLAAEAGLEVTFMAWPEGGEHGVVEMRKV